MTTEPTHPADAGAAPATPPSTTGAKAPPEPMPPPGTPPAPPAPPPGTPPAPVPPPPPASSDELARLIASKHAELSAKGYADGVINAALKRSMVMSTELGDVLSPEIREQGTIDLLRASLADTEAWCKNYTDSLSQ